MARLTPGLEGDFWARFRIELGQTNRAWAINLMRAGAALYDERGALVASTGEAIPYRERVPRTLVPYLPLPYRYRSGDILFLHVRGALRDITGLRLVETEELTAIERGFWIQFALVAGALGTLAALRLILAIRLRDAAMFAYVASCIGFILYEAVDVRVGWALLWPAVSIPFGVAQNAAIIVFLLGRTLFVRTFVPLARLAPIADKVFLAGVGLMIVRAFSEMVWPIAGSAYLNGLAAFLTFGAAIVGIVICARKGSREAWFSLLAFAGFAPFALATLLAGPELLNLPSNFIFDHGVEIGICLEAVLLSFGLAERVRSADQERIAAQRLALDVAARHNEAVTRFVPLEFIEHLGRSDVTQLVLGDHVLRRMSVLFSDIRSFTALSETMNPDENFRFLNSYLSHLGPVIREHHGFIDKFIGDAIMGLFPGPAEDGLRAAVGLHRRLDVYNTGRLRAGYRAIACGVGVHRGDLMLGTIGEAQRMDTTVIADVVNLASRLEGLTKLYGARVLVSDEVIAELENPNIFTFRDLGLITAKGKAQPTRLRELLDADDEATRAWKSAELERFSAALAAFRAGSFGAARDQFASLAARCPADGAVAHYLKRSRELAIEAPLDWDGVDHLLAK